MNEINIYIEKLDNNTFSSSDVPLVLKVLRQDSKSGRIELNKNDVSLLQVYTFALQQLELANGNASSSVHTGDWRETVDDLSMLKQLMDEMEERKVITNVAWNAGSMAIFGIPDAGVYRRYIYNLIFAHLNKLYRLQ
ncbi:hypothetical protein [Methanolobus bombayensis]|uniref:hypothetical protein n=1 Tax=Methanolobus bombayensis TaxID=38023 RepID=UPI001AE795C5|nr:hypothetical protein [Methanolobus bombayensis]MBP1907867.1 hypothetical protein [Methanolobus bombayensis]